MPTKSPRAALPPPLLSLTPGTWAHDTMSRRVRDEILGRIFRENTLPPQHHRALEYLLYELERPLETPLTYIPSDGGPDVDVWNHVLRDHVEEKKTWLSAPWCVTEFYLYRRIMSAIEYFKTPTDPFGLQKELGLSSAAEGIGTLAKRVNDVFARRSLTTSEGKHTHFQSFVLTSLWGNRMDLSLWPVGGNGDATEQELQRGTGVDRAAEAFSSVLDAGQRMILANDVGALTEYMSHMEGKRRVDIVVDNAGFELFCDLCLADFLLFSGMADVVHVQLKAHPTFVSDAMAKDVSHTIEVLCRSIEPDVSELGNRWKSYVATGGWILKEHFFWVQPQAMWQMPDELRSDIAHSRLTIVKGDANYRRLLGDRDWNFETPFEDILCYFPSPVCALRTLKAELACGLSREGIARASREDDRWLVAGKYGVVQFCDTRNIES